ncbi:MAG TPA: DinB family protein [Chloroflexia bacterium]|nr:DinB family protein [Chloroflexia bacterium]
MPDMRLLNIAELSRRYLSEGGKISELSVDYSREEICAFIRENINAMLSLVERMTPAQLAYRLPGAPSGYDESGDEAHFDTSEIITHMASGTAFHWRGMSRALGDERPPFPQPPEGANVTGKKKGMGSGGWSGAAPAELAALLRGTVDAFLAYVEALPPEIDPGTKSNLWIFRDMSPHDWLFLVGIHSAMHLIQIQEMQAQPDYPAA